MSRDLKDEYFAGLAINDTVSSKTVVGAPASRWSNTIVSRDFARKMGIDETCFDKNTEWLYFIKLGFLFCVEISSYLSSFFPTTQTRFKVVISL
jgi:hypothetical protein